MIDTYRRRIDYLRISVTDRCNLHCRYCRPLWDYSRIPEQDLLSIHEIVDFARTIVDMGVTKIRLTGGEPLMRPGIVTLVGELAGLPGLRDLAMTTNGTLLSEFVRDLAAAGLQRVNVSLDTADPLRFKRITRGGDIHRVWAGIAAARQAGLGPIKINCVRGTHTGPEDIAAVKALGDREGLEVRVIQEMSFARGAFAVIGRGSGGDCTRCNRLRLTCNGFLRPCLFSDRVFDIRQLGCERAIEQAVFSKPHAGGPCSHRAMVGLGG